MMQVARLYSEPAPSEFYTLANYNQERAFFYNPIAISGAQSFSPLKFLIRFDLLKL